MGETDKPDAKADEQGQEPEQKNDQPQAGTEQSQAEGTDDGKPIVEEHPDLKRARAEAAKYRTELRKYEKADEERKKAEMTEAEKVAERNRVLDEREAKFAKSQQDFTARQQVIEEARKAGFRISPERVYALVKDGLIFEDGEPTNVSDVVAQLAEEEKGLIGARNGSPSNPDRQRGQGLTAADIRKMSQKEISELPREVLESLSV